VTGKLGRNLRSGHRAEGLGIELLRELCAVAQVPQTEDVGFDAVATILRGDGGLLRAERSFCVQFKARSVREITYDRAAYHWLRALELPLFIGSVDAVAQELSLFSTHNAACRIDAEHYDLISLRLDPSSKSEGRTLQQSLGDPIVSWTHQSAQSDDFKQKAYDLLTAWVKTEQLHRSLRSINTSHVLTWRTNEPPVSGGTIMMGHPDDLRRDADAAAPYLMKLGTHFLSLEEPTDEACAFLIVAQWLDRQGFEQFNAVAQALALHLASVRASRP
jgi:hypothetical protein